MHTGSLGSSVRLCVKSSSYQCGGDLGDQLRTDVDELDDNLHHDKQNNDELEFLRVPVRELRVQVVEKVVHNVEARVENAHTIVHVKIAIGPAVERLVLLGVPEKIGGDKDVREEVDCSLGEEDLAAGEAKAAVSPRRFLSARQPRPPPPGSVGKYLAGEDRHVLL